MTGRESNILVKHSLIHATNGRVRQPLGILGFRKLTESRLFIVWTWHHFKNILLPKDSTLLIVLIKPYLRRMCSFRSVETEDLSEPQAWHCCSFTECKQLVESDTNIAKDILELLYMTGLSLNKMHLLIL